MEGQDKCPITQTEEAATTAEKDVPGADNRSLYGTEQPERAELRSLACDRLRDSRANCPHRTGREERRAKR